MLQNFFSSRYFWIFLFVLHLVLRLSSFWTTFLDVDESQFAGFAHVLLDGGKPYLDSLDTKPLGIYFYYAACFFVFGRQAMWGVHLVTALWSFVSAVFLAKIFDLHGQKHYGRVSAVLFVLFSSAFLPKFIATSINSVMLPLLVISAFFVAKSEVRLREQKTFFEYDFLAGLVLGLAFLFKYQAGIQTVHFFILTLLQWRKSKKFQQFFMRNFLFGVAFLLPFFCQSLLLVYQGVWDDFWFWSIEGSGKYLVSGTQTLDFFKSFYLRFGGYVAATAGFWFLVARAFWRRKSSTQTLFVFTLLWFLLSLIPVFLGGRFYAHYFLQILPAACLLAASAQKIERPFLWRGLQFFLILPVLFFWGLRLDHKWYLQHFPDDELYEQQDIGLHLKSIAKPDDHIFVWGFATAIYFYAECKPASRFLWADWLTGRSPGADYVRKSEEKVSDYQFAEAWDMLWDDFTKHPPRFFVDTSVANFHNYGNYQIIQYPKLYELITTQYRKIAQIQGVDIYERNRN